MNSLPKETDDADDYYQLSPILRPTKEPFQGLEVSYVRPNDISMDVDQDIPNNLSGHVQVGWKPVSRIF
jgi:hypothetical protein